MKITVNGIAYEVTEAQGERRLLDWLREDLDLTGTKSGCEVGACGACTVLVDGHAVKSCIKRVKEAAGAEVLTIGGLTPPDGSLHPLQQAFLDAGAVQCGFCTPGMILRAHALLLKNPAPGREEIRRALQGNLCRCTGYQQIIDAVELAAKSY
ncbi:MAG TPA: (2Fe-2S)-binding protein [bacterium]|nr:(2Fe-2S)-binding protein [bacterium]